MTGPSDDQYATARANLIEGLRQREDLGESTLDVMGSIPRHMFVPESHRNDAYRDTPLPIGEGQTISAPHMVALMTDLLELEPGHQVLEIGTGCGYHAAVTAAVVGAENVYSVEYHDPLAEEAEDTLDAIGYGEISIRAGDGREGWADHAPYDRAYMTCAGRSFPDAVVDQVRTGGILLGPIGNGAQVLVKARKQGDDTLERSRHGAVRFVTLQ